MLTAGTPGCPSAATPIRDAATNRKTLRILSLWPYHRDARRLRLSHALLVHGDLKRGNLRRIVELEDELCAAGHRNRAEQLRLRRRLPGQFVRRCAVNDQSDLARCRRARDEVLPVQFERIAGFGTTVRTFYENPLRLFIDRYWRQDGDIAGFRHDYINSSEAALFGVAGILLVALTRPDQRFDRVRARRQNQCAVVTDPAGAKPVAHFRQVQREPLAKSIAHDSVGVECVDEDFGGDGVSLGLAG